MRPTSLCQFERTRSVRYAVYRQARLSLRRCVLEVGSGEGPVAAEIAARTGRPVCAVDLAPPRKRTAGLGFVCGDGHALPFRDASFDAVAFHFAVLWLRDPIGAFREVRRVLAPGGVVMILAEPDLAARRDEPDTGLGRRLAQTVAASGGSPDAGRRVAGWLREAGFACRLLRTPARWIDVESPAEIEEEIAFLREAGSLPAKDEKQLAAVEHQAIAGGTRRVFLPLTYGIADRNG